MVWQRLALDLRYLRIAIFKLFEATGDVEPRKPILLDLLK